MKKLVAVLTSEHHDMYADAAKMVAEIAKQGILNRILNCKTSCKIL